MPRPSETSIKKEGLEQGTKVSRKWNFRGGRPEKRGWEGSRKVKARVRKGFSFLLRACTYVYMHVCVLICMCVCIYVTKACEHLSMDLGGGACIGSTLMLSGLSIALYLVCILRDSLPRPPHLPSFYMGFEDQNSTLVLALNVAGALPTELSPQP